MSDKQVTDLFKLFSEEYKAKYGNTPSFNRYREKWGFRDMLTDLGFEEAQQVVRFFFKTGGDHTTARLFGSYDSLRDQKDKSEKDQARIEDMMKATEQRVREWEAKHGNHRS